MELLAYGFLLGALIAAPLGPVGVASLVYIIGNKPRSALAAMTGNLLAEALLALLAISGSAVLGRYVGHLPGWLYFTGGALVLALGGWLVVRRELPRAPAGLSLAWAFKLTLFAPNNLAAIVGLMNLLGVAPLLVTNLDCGLLLASYMTGAATAWLTMLGLGYKFRKSETVQDLMPWFIRAVGAFLLVVGAVLCSRGVVSW